MSALRQLIWIQPQSWHLYFQKLILHSTNILAVVSEVDLKIRWYYIYISDLYGWNPFSLLTYCSYSANNLQKHLLWASYKNMHVFFHTILRGIIIYKFLLLEAFFFLLLLLLLPLCYRWENWDAHLLSNCVHVANKV